MFVSKTHSRCLINILSEERKAGWKEGEAGQGGLEDRDRHV